MPLTLTRTRTRTRTRIRTRTLALALTLTLLEQADSSAARLLAALKLDKSEVASEVERGEALELVWALLTRTLTLP